jgi:hypothetical protein
LEKSNALRPDTWKKYTRKVPTEDCFMLDARRIFSSDRPPPPAQGVLRWVGFANGEEYEAAPAQPFTLRESGSGLVLTLKLWYSAGEQVIHTGWKRRQTWFVCGECGRRVRKLYCPPGGGIPVLPEVLGPHRLFRPEEEWGLGLGDAPEVGRHPPPGALLEVTASNGLSRPAPVLRRP